MMDVEGRPRVVHPVSSYIDYSKDKQGLTQASLRVPSWVRAQPLAPTPELEVVLPAGLDWGDRGTADGGSPTDSQVRGLVTSVCDRILPGWRHQSQDDDLRSDVR